MKPWENVKRDRTRRKLFGYAALTIIATVAVITLSNLNLSKPTVKSSASTPASRNDARKQSLKDLSQAIKTYLSTHPKLPAALPTGPVQICAAPTSACKSEKTYDLNFLLTTDTGLQSIPSDPVGGAGRTASGFAIRQDGGKIVLSAPRAEEAEVITLSVK